MPQAATYSSIETLRDGRRVEIRALKPDDRAGLLAAVGRISAQSLYRRFFAVRRHFTEQEIESFANVDFVDHVALVAVVEEGERPVIVGGGRYIVVQPGQAEVAFAVVEELIAEVLPDNAPMLKVFEKSGLHPMTTREGGVVHVTLRLS